MKNQLFTIFLIVFIGLMGFSILIPLLPSFAESFGASELVQGLLVASYAAAQFIGAPILGRLSDRYGRRPILLISVFGTFLSLLMMGFANTLLILFLSRALDGLTGGNISVAQAYIADITDESNRAKGMGIVGAAFGLGFIIGPAVGGIFSNIGSNVVAPAVADMNSPLLSSINWTYALPAFVAALVGFFNLLQVYFLLPESLSPEKRAEKVKNRQAESVSIFSPSALRKTFARPRVGPLLKVRLFYGFSFSMFETVFPIYAAVQLGLIPAEIAFVLTYVGFIAVFVQGFAVGRLADRFPEDRLLFTSTWLMALSLLGWGLAPSVPVLLIVLIPLAFAGGLFLVVINTALTKAVSREESGSILGISTSLESLTRVIAPPIGGLMIGSLGAWSPGILGALLTGATAVYVFVRIVGQGGKMKAESLSAIPGGD